MDKDPKAQKKPRLTKSDMKRLLSGVAKFAKSEQSVEKKEMLSDNEQAYVVMKDFLDQYLDGYLIFGMSPFGEDFVLSKYQSARDFRAVRDLVGDYLRGNVSMNSRQADGNSFEEDDD